jgi:hypothetical protein
MRARIRAPSEIEELPIEITFTLTLKEWRDVARLLPTGWPAWKFAGLIMRACDHLTKAVDVVILGRDAEPLS